MARVEEIGPLLLDQLAQLLGHARVTLAPVIDLATSVSVNGYEHPSRSRPAPGSPPPATSSPTPRPSAATPTWTTPTPTTRMAHPDRPATTTPPH